MSKKRLSNRLEKLFSDLDPDTGSSSSTPVRQLDKGKTMSGWTWMCDAEGRFIACSLEVAGLLGVQPQEFIGQPLQSFKLPLASANALGTALSKGKFPIEINLNYETQGGRSLPVSLYIHQATSPAGEKPGLRGFTQVLSVDREAVHQDNHLTTRAHGFVAVGEQVNPAKSILTDTGKESLRRNLPIINKGSPEEPAVIAVSRPLEEGSNLLLEILDDSSARKWSGDELLLLEQVAGYLSLALEKARLVQKTQAARTNMDNLYQAAAELTAAQSFKDILAILLKYPPFRTADRLLSLNMFNRPWVGDDIPEWNLPIARRTPLQQGEISTRHSMRAYPFYRHLSPRSPTLIEDVASDPRLDENTRLLYLHRFQAKSLIFTPLSFAGKWIGLIQGAYGETVHFREDELNHLMALAQLVSVVIQNMKNIGLAEQRARVAAQNARLLEETRRLSEQLQQKDRHLAEIIHTMHNSLNSIIGFSRVILKGIDGPITDLQKQDLVSIYNSGQHLQRLLNDILDLLNLEAGKTE